MVLRGGHKHCSKEAETARVVFGPGGDTARDFEIAQTRFALKRAFPPISDIPGINGGPARYQCREKDRLQSIRAEWHELPEPGGVPGDGIDGFGSATEEDAESADVEPFSADATHAAEFDNLLAANHQTIKLKGLFRI